MTSDKLWDSVVFSGSPGSQQGARRPLAGHAHISCSPVLSDVQISPKGSTFCPLRFAGVCSNFLALLTALLTECLCNLCKGSSNSIGESFRKTTVLMVEIATLRIDVAPSATASATHENLTSRRLQYRTLLSILAKLNSRFPLFKGHSGTFRISFHIHFGLKGTESFTNCSRICSRIEESAVSQDSRHVVLSFGHMTRQSEEQPH